MVKWMHYLAVAMLLAAAVDAAAVAAADVAAASAVDVAAASAVDVSALNILPVILTKFNWKVKAAPEDAKGNYASLEVTFDPPITVEAGTWCTITYPNEDANDILVSYEVSVDTDTDTCVFEFTDSQNGDPSNIVETYELVVTKITEGESPEVTHGGVATFETTHVDMVPATGAIGCGTAKYTRTVNDDNTCVGGKPVDLGDGKFACYKPAGDDDPTVPDDHGCLTLDDTAHSVGDGTTIDVCLEDKVSGTVEEKTATSLAVNSLTSEDGALDITYTGGTPDDYTILEVILQGSTDTAANELLQVFKFEVSTETDTPVTIDPYAQGLKTYDVCGVLSQTADTTHLVDVKTVETSGTITDLNVFMMEDVTAELVEFGFNNARAGADRLYYATLADGTDVEEVGIDCEGVAQGHTCYGFLSTATLIADVAKLLTVQYGTAGAGGDTIDPNEENNIIVTVPKPETPQ